MKRVFVIAFCLWCVFIKAQSCDTICLNNGARFYGVVTNIDKRRFSITNCDSTGVSTITFLKKDVKFKTFSGLSYNKERRTRFDTLCYFHIGVIPYQILSRSSGMYVGYNFKHISLEYRPTYTYATNLDVSYFNLFHNDNWYFQGINNSLILYIPISQKNKIGIIASYKYWWHNKLSIENDISSYAYNDPNFKESKSVYMSGIGFGFEFTHDLSFNHFEISAFTNASLTAFFAKTHLFSYDGGNYKPTDVTYPSDQTNSFIHGNITAGLKIGYRKLTKY